MCEMTLTNMLVEEYRRLANLKALYWTPDLTHIKVTLQSGASSTLSLRRVYKEVMRLLEAEQKAFECAGQYYGDSVYWDRYEATRNRIEFFEIAFGEEI